MSSLLRREPLEFSMPTWSRRIERLFNEPFMGELPTIEEGTLAIDVSDDDQNVIVRASLPGYKKDDVNVEVHDGVVSINAQHADEEEVTGENFYRKERRYGAVSRRVAVPCPVMEDDAIAELKDGVLMLTVPKTKGTIPHKIRIK